MTAHNQHHTAPQTERERHIDRGVDYDAAAIQAYMGSRVLFLLDNENRDGRYHDIEREFFDLELDERLRILQDLVDRGLVEYDDGYHTTDKGKLANERLTSVLIERWQPDDADLFQR